MDFRQETIIAKATPSGVGAISVVRISGNLSFKVVESLLNGKPLPQSHTIKLRKLYSGEKLLDEGMVATFKGPASFTGEDMAELYLHGADYIVEQVIQQCVRNACRLAEPGEFTQRAYLNGKLDLSQAEAVADVIAAQSAGAHKIALNQLKGGVSTKIADFRAQILESAALIELELDFGEEDVEFASREDLRQKIEALREEVSALLSTFQSGNAIKEGVPVAIVGKPNAGKSTLLNALLGEERAIVTHIPGTTRDTVEEYFKLEGIRFRLIDTAGIRESEDLVEGLGIDRTYKSLEKASVVLLVCDAATDTLKDIEGLRQQLKSKTNAVVWTVYNKLDLQSVSIQDGDIGISAGTGKIDPLLKRLSEYAKNLMSEAGDTTISHLRHAEALRKVAAGIQNVLMAMDNKQSGDILAFELRDAMAELGKITGEIDSEDILGEIFGKFCIGK